MPEEIKTEMSAANGKSGYEPELQFDKRQTAEFQSLVKEFVKDYSTRDSAVSDAEWLSDELQKHIQNVSAEEAAKDSAEILGAIAALDNKQHSLESAKAERVSTADWLDGEFLNATKNMSLQQSALYLSGIDDLIRSSNDYMRKAVTTKAGIISNNPNLDGFIAEAYHAQTFNINAEIADSKYRAEVLVPDGKAYGKNSVDIVLKDITANGNSRAQSYQVKYGKDANATDYLFKGGDYRGQRKIVPDGQEGNIPNAYNVIEAPDGVKGSPLNKEAAKGMQGAAQQGGRPPELDYKAINPSYTKTLAYNIAKEASEAAMISAALAISWNIVRKLGNGEDIDGAEILKVGAVTVADVGTKAAVAGALKVAAGRGLLGTLAKATSAGTFATIANIGIESLRIFTKTASGEFTPQECIDKIADVTASTIAGVAVMPYGAFIGASLGAVLTPALGPFGIIAGGFIGGVIGSMLGSKTGMYVLNTVRSISDAAHGKMSGAARHLGDAVNTTVPVKA